MNYKDPETGAHTNAIESSWRAAKAVFAANGRKKSSIPGNLARYMFYKQCQDLKLDRIVEFFRLAGELYNPMSPREKYDEDDITDEDDF